MQDEFKKVLYLGAGLDINVVNYFPDCNEFVLIDTQPRSEHDQESYFYEGYYRNRFLERLINKCKKYGFVLNEIIELDSNYMNLITNIEKNPEYIDRELKDVPYINPHLLIFMKNIRTIKYYISTNIIFNMNPILEKDISESDTLYIAGYHPDCELLKYLNNKKRNFVGSNSTIYYTDYDETENNIIKFFIENNIMDEYFDKYYLMWTEKSSIILCNNLEDLNNKRIVLWSNKHIQ